MKKVYTFLVIILLIIVFRNFLFNLLFSYKVIDERPVLNLEQRISDENLATIEDIIEYELEETASLLNFTFNKCENEPNKLLKSKHANCIGYSAFLASSIINKLNSESLKNEWEVKHNVAEIYFLGYNVHPFFKSKFFKNHDFVVIENKKTNEIIAVDPALYDYFRINKIRLR